MSAKTALPNILAQQNAAMIQCSPILVEYAICKNINSTVCSWGIEILSVELKPFSLTSSSGQGSSGSTDGLTTIVNLIQNVAGHNVLPQKDDFSIQQMVTTLEPYLRSPMCPTVVGVILLTLTGDKGGECLIDFKNRSMILEPKSCHPDATLTLAVETFLSIVNEKVDIRSLYQSGKVKIEGDINLIWKLRDMFS